MQTIDYQQLKDLQKRNAATIINVLPAEKFPATHIFGSLNVPLAHEDFAGNVKRIIGGKELPVVVYCASFSCDASKKAALKLEQAGFTDVMCYEGGFKEYHEKEARSSAA